MRWKGFSSKFDSWEPEENLFGCEDVLTKFNKEEEARVKRAEEIKGRASTPKKSKPKKKSVPTPVRSSARISRHAIASTPSKKSAFQPVVGKLIGKKRGPSIGDGEYPVTSSESEEETLSATFQSKRTASSSKSKASRPAKKSRKSITGAKRKVIPVVAQYDEPEYIVEKILDHQNRTGMVKYFIKWEVKASRDVLPLIDVNLYRGTILT